MATSMLRLALIGKTGAGKSKTGNTILNLNNTKPSVFRSSAQGMSVTDVCEVRHDKVLGRKVQVIDTPGILDNRVENQETVLNEITRCIYMSAPGPHAILHVTEIGRFTDEDVQSIEKFVKLFGDGLFKYICIIFTRFDDLKRDSIDNGRGGKCDIRSHVQTLPEKVQQFINIKCQGRVLAFDNTLTGLNAEEQVQSLFSVVDGLVRENGGSCYNNNDLEKANEVQKKVMEEERIRLDEQLKKEMEVKEKAIENAANLKAKDKIKKEMEIYRHEMKQKMENDNLRYNAQNSTSGFESFKTMASVLEAVKSAASLVKMFK